MEYCCDFNMIEAGSTEFDSREAQELFHRGLRPGCLRCNTHCQTTWNSENGADLFYWEGISYMDAAVLRRVLLTGPAVRKLCISGISLAALKVAFHGLEQCPSLKNVYLKVNCEGQDIGTTLSVAFRNLHTLELRCENTGPRFARDVADYIRQNKSLRDVVLWNSCGGDGGAAVLIEALTVNDALMRFSLSDMELSSDTLIGFAMMLATNSTLEFVNLNDVCPVEKNKVCCLLAQERYARVFERLDIVWPEHLLPELKVLIREGACFPVLTVSITSSVNEEVLWEFLNAVGTRNTPEGIRFASVADDYTFDALAESIASALKWARKLQKIEIFKHVRRGNEHQLLVVLDALKWNHSVSKFTMYAESVTPEIAASLSKLLEVNNTLTTVDISGYDGIISTTEVKTILRGLRTNYTLTKLEVSDDPDDSEEMSELEEILTRNHRLLNQAANFVISGANVRDQGGAHALKKVRSSPGLVERVRDLTGRTTEAVLKEIQSVLVRLNL